MAAAKSERVMDMVRRELQKNPTIKSQDLFEKAKKIDSGLSNLSIRQFHASYPLQVKRMAGRAAGGAKRGRKRTGGTAVKKTTTGRRPGRPRGRPRKSTTAAPAAAGRPRRGRPPGSRSAGGSGREGVRSILMQFAGELAGAENRSDVVQVMGNVDSYVDRLLQAATS